MFDEPTTGLHPLDVATLVSVFDRLLDAGAAIIVIDDDLDLLAAADYLIDMGPGGGPEGGRILAAGPPADIACDEGSVTGPWLAEYLRLPGPGRHANPTNEAGGIRATDTASSRPAAPGGRPDDARGGPSDRARVDLPATEPTAGTAHNSEGRNVSIGGAAVSLTAIAGRLSR